MGVRIFKGIASSHRLLEDVFWGNMTFTRAFNHVNYEDPDINVAIPVFSIHGNHDDPSGVRPISSNSMQRRGSHMLGRPFSCPGFAPDFRSAQLLRTDPRIGQHRHQASIIAKGTNETRLVWYEQCSR